MVASMNPLPPVPAQAEIVLTIMGRNLMVVEDESGPKIVVTGSGPRYDSSSKQALGTIFKCAVLDIVDLMTPDEESSREMRDVFLAFSGILELKETLAQFNKKNKIDARRANLIKTGLKIISGQNPWVPKPDLEAKLLLLGFPDIKQILQWAT